MESLQQEQFEAELCFSVQDFLDAEIEALTSISKWPQVEEVVRASDKWEGKRRYYFMGKKVCHTADYGMGPIVFQMAILKETEGEINLTSKESSAYLEGYHKLFPEIREWHRDVQHELRTKRLLRNLFGYPRVFTGFMDEQTFKKGYAFIPQSTVGTITNIAFVNLFHSLPEDCDILQNNHDSVLIQCPPERKDEVIKMAKDAINQKLVTPRGDVFYMQSEAKTGPNWMEVK